MSAFNQGPSHFRRHSQYIYVTMLFHLFAKLKALYRCFLSHRADFVIVFFSQEGKGDLAVVLCGDLNSNPHSAVYEYIVSQTLSHNSVDWYTSKDLYKHYISDEHITVNGGHCSGPVALFLNFHSIDPHFGIHLSLKITYCKIKSN